MNTNHLSTRVKRLERRQRPRRRAGTGWTITEIIVPRPTLPDTPWPDLLHAEPAAEAGPVAALEVYDLRQVPWQRRTLTPDDPDFQTYLAD